MNLKIVSASHHRNGVCGTGFYAILFDDAEQGRMIASLFDEPTYCAVYKVSLLAVDNVEFGNGNSWRGDQYENALRPLLAEYLKAKEGADTAARQVNSKPSKLIDEHLEYLDNLRTSGETNMFGAAPYLRRVFKSLTAVEARQIVSYWMKTFSERAAR